MKCVLALSLSVAMFSAALCQRSHLTISNDFNIIEKQYQEQTISNAVYHNNFFYTSPIHVSAQKNGCLQNFTI